LRKPVDGLDEETIELCEDRRRARTRMLANSTNDEIRSDYNVINKAVKKAVKQAKIKALENKTKLIEKNFRENKTHELFKNIKELEAKPKKPVMALKDATGKKTTNSSEILTIWKKHYEKYLNRTFPRDEEILDNIDIPALNNDQFDIEKEDVVKAIKHLKLKKAPGHDGVSSEALKAGGGPTVNVLHKLFNKVLSTNEVPSEWSKMMVTPIYKKRRY